MLAQQDQLLPKHVAFTDRARRQCRVGDDGTVDRFFSCEGCADDTATYRVLAASAAGMLPEIEARLVAGEAGPNVSSCGVFSA
ncbi:hypothetical protein [Variovorax sp. W2I14]|uniref:hypothetical protein n=1 Tax=Variovorax sp. W2I14 TaxID=3042290 RepID=UPI003D22E34C